MTTAITQDARSFRNALGCFATGVTIVTTRDKEGRDVGLTANSFNSVSLDPPMVLWSLAKTSNALDAFMNGDHFAVHILSRSQQDLSNRFAQKGIDKFAGLEVGRGGGDVPLLEGCSACFECKTLYRYEGGDHMIFVGEVINFQHADQLPLVYHSGAYKYVVHHAGSRKPAEETCSDNDGSFDKNFLGYLLGAAYQKIFSGIRGELATQDLSEEDYLTLSIVGIADSRSRKEVDSLLQLTGRCLTDEIINKLIDRQLLVVTDSEGEARLELSSTGRSLQIRLLAVAKAGEANMEEALDEGEAMLLKSLLRRVLHGSEDKARLFWGEKIGPN